MQYTFTAEAVIRLEQIVNLWPIGNRAESVVIDKLAQELAIKESEFETVHWQPTPDGMAITYQPDTPLIRNIDAADLDILKHMAEHPPEKLAWSRRERQLQSAIFEPLGLEPWFTSN